MGLLGEYVNHILEDNDSIPKRRARIVRTKKKIVGLSKAPYFKADEGDFDYVKKKSKRVRFSLENNYLISNSVSGNYVHGELNFATRFSLTADYYLLRQSLFRAATTEYEHFAVMANYYLLRDKYVSIWHGLGMRYVGEDIGLYGPAYQIGLRMFLEAPISLESTYKTSLLHNKFTNQFDVHLKWHYKKLFLSSGYNRIAINGSYFKQFSIGIGAYL